MLPDPKPMLRLLFLFSLLMGVNFFTWGQNIIVRNNCITQCTDCAQKTADMGTVFDLDVNMPTGTKYLWDFGEPGTPDNTSTNRTGTHLYCTPGDKVVTLKLSSNPTPIKKTIKVGQLPFIYLGKDQNDSTITICSGQELTLKAFEKVGKPNYPVNVVWYPDGQTSDDIKLNKSGCYSVKVSDPISGCSVESKMQVKICDEKLIKTDPKYTFAMGSGAAIEFQGSADYPVVVTGKTNVPNGVATIKDPNGLKLYSDGVNVYGPNDQPILYSDPTKKINTDIMNSQGVQIIPKESCKGCTSEYYIFNLGKNFAGENVVYYSIVDMKLNSGKGGISVINQLLNPVPVTSKLTVVEGPQQQYYWLVSQNAITGELMSFKVNKYGITAPVKSTGGTITSSSGASGTSKMSIDQTQLAITLPDVNMNSIDLYSLDIKTGKFTLTYNLPIGKPLPKVYGLEYSTNGNIIYVSVQGDGLTIPSEIWQFDLTSKDPAKIIASKSVLFSSIQKIGALQMDPVSNTVIYVTFEGSNTLAKISQTNQLNTEVDPKNRPIFTRNAVTFPSGVFTNLGLPSSVNPPPTPPSGPEIKGPSCEGTNFSFTISQKLCDPLNNDRIDWKIYKSRLDPIKNIDGIIVPINPAGTLIYSYSGEVLKFDFPTSDKYVITASITNSCVSNYLLNAQEFDIVVLKPSKLTPIYNRICKTDAIIALTQLPVSSNLQYQWSTGASTPFVRIPNPGGKVTLNLSDSSTGCSTKLTTEVNFLDNPHFIPTVNYSICMDEPKPYNLTLNGNVDSLKFEWKFGSNILSTQNKVRVTQAGKYTVKITDLDNCSIDHTFDVSDKCEPTLLTPNVFTPNGDGKNDFFVPQPKNPLRAKILGLQIFNRWGELLYTTKGPEFAWDGKVNGTRVPQDSYVWQLQYESLDYPERGTLTERGGVLVIY